MRILFLTHYFYPHIGGVEKHVWMVAKELIKLGHQVVIVTSQDDPHLPLNQNWEGMEIVRISLPDSDWQRPAKFQFWQWMVKQRKIFSQADIIHCHDVFFWYLPLRWLLFNKPVYITFHGYEGVFPPLRKAIIIRKLSEKLSWGNICVGDYIKKWYGTSPDLVTYGATEIPKKISTYKSKKSALFLGRLAADTGLLVYLDALKILKKQGINLKTEFCGGGNLETQARRFGRILGWQKDISGPLKRNRFALVSSYLSILEAMAHRRLVIAVYNNGLKRDSLTLSPFANLIVICSSAEEVVDKVGCFLQNPQVESMVVEQAYRWVQTQTWDKLVQGYLHIWKLV